MKKVIILLAVVVLLSACAPITKYGAGTYDAGDFKLLVDDYRYTEPGVYQAGVRVIGYGSVDIVTSGGVLIEGGTTYSRLTAGEYWFFIDTSGMAIGDIGQIETTEIDGPYVDVPDYKTYTLIIEVQ